MITNTNNLLPWIPLLPFAGALLLLLTSARMPKFAAGVIGCLSVGSSFIVVSVLGLQMLSAPKIIPLRSVLWEWMKASDFSIKMGFYFDALSLVMAAVVTFVAFLIHLYASQSMYGEDGYRRFLAYMNLFVGAMLTLVLADNLLVLFLGWEGVGLCSYLLIGFWYKDKANGFAAQKAFILTRIGDTALMIGLFLLFREIGSLDILTIRAVAPLALPTAGAIATLIAFLFIGGAVGKSAQIPLHTWLPDAMAGPTPVSALIHAATMVTAGVYLIARMNFIFEISPRASFAVAIIGSVTLLYAGLCALAQSDIKRVLAYSTVSQIGYMFLALGVGSYTGAIFHLMTHAFFKALLFLSAGIVIDALHHEHNIFRMGGLRKKLPWAYWTFLIGASSISALPLVTAGFYSKDAILWASYGSKLGNTWFWMAALIGALLTGIYSFRVFFLVFYGERDHEISAYPGSLMKLSLAILAVFSIIAGFVEMPEVILHYDPWGAMFRTVFPKTPFDLARSTHNAEWSLISISAFESFIGIYIAYLYMTRRRWSEAFGKTTTGKVVHSFLKSGFGFDWIYDRIFVRPFKFIAYANRQDCIDYVFAGMAAAVAYANRALTVLQTGKLRDYAAGLVCGSIFVVIIALFLR